MITVDTTTNGRLYWEARGNGQPVLLIAGTPGDAGQFASPGRWRTSTWSSRTTVAAHPGA
jgi:hypothetical protein